MRTLSAVSNRYKGVILRVFLSIIIVAGIFSGCTAREIKELTTCYIDTAKWDSVDFSDNYGAVVCFSEESVMIAAETSNGKFELLETDFETDTTVSLIKDLQYMPNIIMLCEDGNKFCFISGIASKAAETEPKMRYLIAELHNGEIREFILSEDNTPNYPEPVLYNSNIYTSALPCRSGFAVKFVDTYIDENKNVYSVRLFDTNAETEDCYRIVAEEAVDTLGLNGKRFISYMSHEESEDHLWLMSEEIKSGERTSAPKLEKYSLDGELLETRELNDWDWVADAVEKRHEIPYDVGALEFAVAGKDGRYLYINYQVDSVFFEWKNGKYHPIGIVKVPEDSDTTLNQMSLLTARCSGCANADKSSDLMWMYRYSDAGQPERLYAFDVQSGKLYSIGLPFEQDENHLTDIAISCGGDILVRSYLWEDQTGGEPDGMWLLSAESVAEIIK